MREVVFTELLRRRTIVSIYMRNNTPSCDRQVESLRAQAVEFDRAGYDVVAVSRDTSGSQIRCAGKKNLFPLTLVSDPADFFAQAADAVVDKVLYGRKYRGPARSAFVLGPDATVLAVIDKVDPKTHAEQLWAVVRREASVGD